MTATTETWLDVMPAIELARGVPFVDRVSGYRGVLAFAPARRKVSNEQRERPDLDDPQGFGYALRKVWPHVKAMGPEERGRFAARCGLHATIDRGFAGMRDRHFMGATDNADRLALARACREVAEVA